MGHQKIDLIFSYKWRRQWHPTPVLLPGKSHGRRSLVGCRGRQESDTTERLHFHFSLSYIGEGNGCPLQCSCLENPRDRGAWWAAIYGVAQSWTWLKRLSSSSIQTHRDVCIQNTCIADLYCGQGAGRSVPVWTSHCMKAAPESGNDMREADFFSHRRFPRKLLAFSCQGTTFTRTLGIRNK